MPAVKGMRMAGPGRPIAAVCILNKQRMCDTRTLAQTGQAHISQCQHCKMIFLWHGNLLLSFAPDDFLQFRTTLHQRKFDDYALPFPDAAERVIMHSPCHDISFTFTKAEWADMLAAVEEALLMQQVYALI